MILTVLMLGVASSPAYAAPHPAYRIPPGNPFEATPGARPEVFALGMRNPYRWSFDRQTGDFYVGDVGSSQREEITFVPRRRIARANLGWNCFEGTVPQRQCKLRNYFPPSHQYLGGPDVVIGGYVVRAPDLPSFAGRYLYGRYSSGIYSLSRKAAGKAVNTGVDIDGITSLAEDGLGRLFATTYDGPVYRLGESGGSLSLTSIGTFQRPVGLAAPMGDPDRLFIIEKRGVIKLLKGGQVSTFLDLTSLVREFGYEEGLVGFATAPDYATSGRVFAYYTDRANGNLQLDEYVRTSTASESSSLTTRRPLLTIPHAGDLHNGGQLHFGRDAYLYLSTGDGQSARGPQSRGSLLGKLLRLDVGAVTPDTAVPELEASVERGQRLLRARAVVAGFRCSERCSAFASGRLKIGGRKYRLRAVGKAAAPNRAARVKLLLPKSASRGLANKPGSVSVQLKLYAVDATGNRSRVVRRQATARP